MAAATLSAEDQEFLAKCEEELKHRYTDDDKEFMKVFNAEPSTPPIIEPWWPPHNSGRRNDRRGNRRNHPYERYGNRDRNYDRRDNQSYDRRDPQDRRSYRDHNRDGGYGGSQYKRPRY